VGKAMLAHDVDATEALLTRGLAPRTPNTIVDAAPFPAELRRTREQGIAISDQEARAQLSCVAIALLDQTRRPVAALAISGSTRGFDVRQQVVLLRGVAAEAERRIRYAAHAERRAS
jgi:DNA-binding IclR family transcriptional regulator